MAKRKMTKSNTGRSDIGTDGADIKITSADGAENTDKSASDEIQPDGEEAEQPVDDRNWFYRVFSPNRMPFDRSRQGSFRRKLNDVLKTSTEETGDFSQSEKAMLRNILLLQDVRVKDLMVPRAEIKAVDISITLGELLSIFESSGHSRMPVYDDTLDDPRGMVHIRDLVAYITRTSFGRKSSRGKKLLPDLTKVDLSDNLAKLSLIRKILFVPPSMLAADLMARMQAARTQIALVIDEYGGTDGLVSLEDIVEVIVGDIEDEHDDDENLIQDLGNGVLRCDAKAEIDDIREALGGTFDVGEHAEDADTIGGIIFSLLSRVPVKGEVVDAFGYEFRILDADPRRVKLVDMVPSKRPGQRN